MLPTWMPFLSKILSTLNPFCLTYCPWNRWWQMFSMSTPCFVRPSFGKDALNFENPFDRDILHAKCSSALWNKGPPEWARALFSGMKYFQGFWLFHLALAVHPDPAKSFRNAASAWRYGTYLGPPFKTHNRYVPKTIILGNLSGPVTRTN